MKLTLVLYGFIAEEFDAKELIIETVETVVSVDWLKTELANRQKRMASLSYSVAVNNTIQKNDFEINTDSEIHVMPPFAGG